MRRPDLSNGVLLALVAAGALAIFIYSVFARPVLPVSWKTPGSAELYLVGVAGTLLLLISMVFVAVKRSGRGGSPPAWFVAHVVAGTLGAVLVVIHSGGALRQPPALLYPVLAGLILLGMIGRVRLASRMASTFASKDSAFTPASGAQRPLMATIIANKRRLLQGIDRSAREGTFSLTPSHWLRTPRAALRYARLVAAENRLMGSRGSVGLEQAYWRPLHLALAYTFVLGVVIHVITVTFFAGYVAAGGPITWWHITDW